MIINDKIKTSPLLYARVAGVLYLIIIVCGLFSEMYVRSHLIIPEDAVTTATNIMDSIFLFRLGFLSDLIMILCDVIVAIIFYILLKSVNKNIALLTVSFRLMQDAILGINLLNFFIPLILISHANYLKNFETNQLYALVLLFLNIHNYGYLIALVFFGIHCFLLGYLMVNSYYFPKLLGFGLMVACFGYLMDSFANFLLPNYTEITSWLVIISAVVAEFSLCLWLLFKGVKLECNLD
ncbi:hypothetical protein cce_2707 [Crocosphaera subtropica ATCC 51142]|uniref:DUF4386 domain-containing protein n=1 Tax=Crocosphaera subtropica (strain ATCC 51142 / BH68) TaxID=43989 RepID=B1WTD3_CROS5|nr:DUF4386 domain-containing protein [Crocosphaera subtropica]ACB52055.1 hypothetical protein cce_2707 [Crocosphaera subtropica ATCC 51142]